MPRKNLFALDLGTTKHCIAMVDHSESSLRVKTVSVPAEGMKRGMITDMPRATQSLMRLVEMAEADFADDIAKVSVGIAGSHLQSRTITIDEELSDRVSDEYLKKLSEKGHQTSNSGRANLHTIPISFSIDGREVLNPVGFSGKSISVNFFQIDVDKNYAADVVELCNRCGLRVRQLHAEPLASASVVLTDTAKNVGAIVADIGGGTTDCLVFVAGQPIKAFSINIGGQAATNDLAIGLGVPKEEAEKIKISWGLATGSADDEWDQTMQSKDVHGRNILVSRKQVGYILRCRFGELFDLILNEAHGVRPQIGSGFVLTGGGSELLGLSQFVNQRTLLPVKKAQASFDGSPTELAGVSTSNLSGKYTTALGLLYLDYQGQAQSRETRPLRSFVRWIREMTHLSST